MKTVDDLSNLPAVEDLRAKYPVATRSIFRRSALWIFVYCGFLICFLLTIYLIPESWFERREVTYQFFQGLLHIVARYFVIGGLLVVFLKLAYELLYLKLYRYQIELEHLVISQGVLFRSRASVLLAKINDVEIERGALDLIFGLYNVAVLSPAPSQSTFIEGLSSHHAIELQNKLLAMIESASPDVNTAAADHMPTVNPHDHHGRKPPRAGNQ